MNRSYSRTILIDKREISILIPEQSYPITFNLDELERKRKQIRKELSEDETDRLVKFDNEKEIAEDILNDYLKEGWRLIKKDEW
jgi:hypothetical protein